MNQIKKITAFALMLLIAGSIDSIRNLPATALFGSSLILFIVFAAVIFLIPVALVSAELSATWTEHGGIYAWVKNAFGDKTAFVAIWLQWFNTMIWYPTILSFIAATSAYLFNPALAQSKVYLVSIIVGVFWLLTLLNLKGVQISTKFTSVCALIGMIIPMMAIIAMGIVWIHMGKPLQIHFSSHALLPALDHTQSWISLTAIMTAFLGMELACVHVNDVKNPQHSFPKAMIAAVVIIVMTMLLGSLAIAVVIPHQQINLVSGVMQTFTGFLNAYHLHFLMPITAILLLLGSLGGMINWIISPAKGLLHASQDGHLPKILAKENKQGVAKNILLLQAILVSLLCSAFLLMPSVNGSYWLLTDLSTQLYMLMYGILFISYIKLKHKYPNKKAAFHIPGGKKFAIITAMAGCTGVAITMYIDFIPPQGINVGGFWHYEILFGAGMIIALLIPLLYLIIKKVTTKSAAC